MMACYYELNISIRINDQIGYRINTIDAKTIFKFIYQYHITIFCQNNHNDLKQCPEHTR